MSILPTSHSHQKVIPFNEGPSMDDIPIVDDPLGEVDSDDEEFDTTVGASKTMKPVKVPFYEKWRRKIQSLTYNDLKVTGLWLMESAKIEFSISVSENVLLLIFSCC